MIVVQRADASEKGELVMVVRTMLIMLALCSSQALAKFAMPGEVPVERLIKNVGAYVKEHPKEAQGYYTLGRVHRRQADYPAFPSISSSPARKRRPVKKR
jgi:hypothetical protein